MDVGDWYLFDEGCYLRIYGCSRPPHIFPHYVTDKMVLLEIAYQNLIDGASHTLSVNKKSVWPPLPLKVGHYFIETAGGAEAQAHALDRFHFSCGNLKRHDPHDVVQKHCTTCKFQEPVAPLLDREPIPVTGLDPVEAEPVFREAKPLPPPDTYPVCS